VPRRPPYQPCLDAIATVLEVGDLLQRHGPASHSLRQERQHELELVVGLDDAVPRSQFLGRLVQPQLIVEDEALETHRNRTQAPGAG